MSSRSPKLVLGVLPVILLFVAPSVAALVILGDERSGSLAPLWLTGAGAVALFAASPLVLLKEPIPRSNSDVAKRRQDNEGQPVPDDADTNQPAEG
jgi:hypothetical protein